jgi:hypothetical protein
VSKRRLLTRERAKIKEQVRIWDKFKQERGTYILKSVDGGTC